MSDKSYEEKEDGQDFQALKKLWTKRLNKFFSDYFGWLIALVVFVILVSGTFVQLIPKYHQMLQFVNLFNQQEQVDFNAKQDELIKTKQLLAAYDSIDKKYVDKVNRIAPLKKNKEELFSEINYLVAKSQLLLQSVSLGEVGPYDDIKLVSGDYDPRIPGNIQEVNISLSVRGTDYDSFKDLLISLENNLRLIDVSSLSFDPGGQATNLSLRTYYSKE